MPREGSGPSRFAAEEAPDVTFTSSCDGVLFDYGGTLVTFEYPYDELLEVVRAFGPSIRAGLGAPAPPAEAILSDVLLPLESYIANLGEDEVVYMDVYRAAWHKAGLKLDDALLYKILDAEQLCWDRAVRVDPEALHVLGWLGSRGIKRGICSNAPFPPEMMRRQLVSNGISAAVDAAIFSSEVGRRKPAPEVYLAALAALGTDPHRTLFVGDRMREDYEGPRAVGMHAALLAAGQSNDFPDGVPTLASIGDLPRLL